MSVTIDWGALGLVFLVSFGAAVGMIVLFAFGVSALATPVPEPAATPDRTFPNTPRPPWAWPLAVFCFFACALVVAFGLYLIIVK